MTFLAAADPHPHRKLCRCQTLGPAPSLLVRSLMPIVSPADPYSYSGLPPCPPTHIPRMHSSPLVAELDQTAAAAREDPTTFENSLSPPLSTESFSDVPSLLSGTLRHLPSSLSPVCTALTLNKRFPFRSFVTPSPVHTLPEPRTALVRLQRHPSLDPIVPEPRTLHPTIPTAHAPDYASLALHDVPYRDLLPTALR